MKHKRGAAGAPTAHEGAEEGRSSPEASDEAIHSDPGGIEAAVCKQVCLQSSQIICLHALLHAHPPDTARHAPPPPPSALNSLIRLQIEFYFSDANLPTDKHLLQQITRDPEGYGKQQRSATLQHTNRHVPVSAPLKLTPASSRVAVSLQALAGFNRVKALTRDVSVVAKALRSSSALMLDEAGMRVRRVEPLPPVDAADITRRIVLVEHLPPSPTVGALFVQL